MDKGTAESAEAARKLTAPIDPGPNGTSTVPTVEGAAVNMLVEYRSDLNGGLQEGFWIGGFAVFGKVENGTETMGGTYPQNLPISPQQIVPTQTQKHKMEEGGRTLKAGSRPKADKRPSRMHKNQRPRRTNSRNSAHGIRPTR